MKMTKKKVFVAALAVCLVAILSLGTLAWFNATDDITNKFLVADSDNNGTPDFSVDVKESNDPEDDGLIFEDIYPNAELAKDPMVTNTGDYSMYTRVVVTLSDASTWMAASNKYNLATDAKMIFEELVDISANWHRYTDAYIDTTADTLTYVYYYDAIIGAGETSPAVFTKVTIPSELQQDDMNFGIGEDAGFTVSVKAEAVQSDKIVDPATDTTTYVASFWAFQNANWSELGNYPAA